MPNMVRHPRYVGTRFPMPTYDALERYANDHELYVAEVVRMAVESFLDVEGYSPTPKRAVKLRKRSEAS